MYTKLQLNFSTKLNAQNTVVERTTLVNVACNSVSECAELYEELKAALGAEIVVSNHQELPQIPARPPYQLPATIERHEPVKVYQNDNDEQPPLCPRCQIPMALRLVKKPGKYFNTRFYGCRNWVRNGCLERIPA